MGLGSSVHLPKHMLHLSPLQGGHCIQKSSLRLLGIRTWYRPSLWAPWGFTYNFCVFWWSCFYVDFFVMFFFRYFLDKCSLTTAKMILVKCKYQTTNNCNHCTHSTISTIARHWVYVVSCTVSWCNCGVQTTINRGTNILKCIRLWNFVSKMFFL